MTAKPIFLLSKPRSGTTVLGKILESSGLVDYIGEPLNIADPGNFFSWLKADILSEDKWKLNDSYSAFLGYIDFNLKKSTRQFVLFDIKYEQFQHIVRPWPQLGFPDAVLAIISELNAHVIQLIRENYLARIISNEVAAATGVYHVDNSQAAIDWRNEERRKRGLISVSVSIARQQMESESRDHLWVARSLEYLNSNLLTVKYESLFKSTRTDEREFEWRLLLRHLDNQLTYDEISKINIPLSKVLPDDPLTCVSNPAELQQMIHGLPEDKALPELKAIINRQRFTVDLLTSPCLAHQNMLHSQIKQRKVHETDFDYFRTLSAKDGLFIDVGASIGTSLLSIHFSCPKWRTLSFEPNKGNHDLLNQAADFARTEGGNCRIFGFGLSDKEETTTLYVPRIDDWFVIGEASVNLAHFDRPVVRRRLSGYSSHGKWDLAAIAIELKVFDELPASLINPVESVVVVKVDVEGHELSVLRGMRKFIAEIRPIFLIENDGATGIADFLSPFGYERFNFIDGSLIKTNESYSLNNFFIATR